MWDQGQKSLPGWPRRLELKRGRDRRPGEKQAAEGTGVQGALKPPGGGAGAAPPGRSPLPMAFGPGTGKMTG